MRLEGVRPGFHEFRVLARARYGQARAAAAATARADGPPRAVARVEAAASVVKETLRVVCDGGGRARIRLEVDLLGEEERPKGKEKGDLPMRRRSQSRSSLSSASLSSASRLSSASSMENRDEDENAEESDDGSESLASDSDSAASLSSSASAQTGLRLPLPAEPLIVSEPKPSRPPPLARAEEDFKIARLGWCSARTSLLGSVSALSALSARPEVAGTPRGGLALASVRAACVCLRVGCCLIQSETESEALAACR